MPIPDINGPMTDMDQALWVSTALDQLMQVPGVVGFNYWVNVGGSTALWDDNGHPKPAVPILSRYYSE